MPFIGTLFILLSASAFAAMPIFGKLALAEGASTGTLLTVRFALAAVVLWGLVAVSSRAVGQLRRLRPRDLAFGLTLGAAGYAGQAGAFFAALERIDVSLLSLLLYTYPTMVAVGAVGLGRDRLDGRRATALLCASAGLVLVLAGAGTGALDPLGAVFSLAAAAIYSTCILSSERLAARLSPYLLTALICSGAGGALAASGLVTGSLQFATVTAAGWGWLACLVLVSTVAAISLFYAGLRRVGPTAAAILSTVEPPVTVGLAFAVFGEVLTPVQALGGALVLGAVVILNLRLTRRPVAVAAA